MALKPVEWVLVVYYGPAAHQATYGRQVREGGYTKDYIQLSRKPEFLEAMAAIFSVSNGGEGSIPLTYQWPAGAAPGSFVFRSADRPHLKWETNLGAPQVWKMALAPSDFTPETIPGDPSYQDFAAAENEFSLISSRGAGQPYLMAIKLVGEARTLHLRVYLKEPSSNFAWGDIGLTPQKIQLLAAKTSQRSALAWSLFESGGAVADAKVEKALAELKNSEDLALVIDSFDAETRRAVANYIRRPGYGLFFDPELNHDAWLQLEPNFDRLAKSINDVLAALDNKLAVGSPGDAEAEMLEVDPDEVELFRLKILEDNYHVADSIATLKTRGSAQKAFSEAVKANYGYRCAITGVKTRDFLVASHVVPWSKDQSIRLDPSNGICLSILVDRAFEKGYLWIENDLTVRFNKEKVGEDRALGAMLEQYDGRKLSSPSRCSPRPEYLQRRRELVDIVSQ
ncbi:HNH endonuclease signature motif containing protein [Xanthomonas sp. SHU 166]|uniref:HNH endonuclease n=1 Tax=Xanthomonas sp. SHU 166 TaxID=1591170 RepID=UPI0005BA6EB1|nr:HNH endonuclease signature motif containing protein [Xanthomonas sp. SHU 166]